MLEWFHFIRFVEYLEIDESDCMFRNFVVNRGGCRWGDRHESPSKSQPEKDSMPQPKHIQIRGNSEPCSRIDSSINYCKSKRFLLVAVGPAAAAAEAALVVVAEVMPFEGGDDVAVVVE